MSGTRARAGRSQGAKLASASACGGRPSKCNESARPRGGRVLDRLQSAAAAEIPTPVVRLEQVFAAQRAAFAREMSPTYGARRDRLDRLLRLTEMHQDAIAAAISADFGHR